MTYPLTYFLAVLAGALLGTAMMGFAIRALARSRRTQIGRAAADLSDAFALGGKVRVRTRCRLEYIVEVGGIDVVVFQSESWAREVAAVIEERRR